MEEGDGIIAEDRTFFCSELIAKTFKVCGIMKDVDNASSNYLPGHFGSDKWDIPLEDGIKVVQERSIVQQNKEEK